ncbi:hypothetical protein F511_35293 [Dorcoceras hygrometricum]|uniref:Uncharacterized protein n=1 Tax=Dorcoceras hygrometricum TaxID=472368 RepID=A0A2Z7ABM8_9LAMI|nr:hypothetical protein F511_35293 [Dorcoceras hygrometricum]
MFSNKLFNSCLLSCCLFFVTTLRATAVSFLRLVVAPLQFTSHLVFLFISATGCPDVDFEVLATASCWSYHRKEHLLIISSAECDDITADVIIADSRACASLLVC